MGRLDNKIALITGGNSGIGFAAARLFAAEGAQVIICGRDKQAIEVAASELGVTGLHADVSSLSDLDRLYAEIGKRFGHLDIVFANAGVANLIPFADVTEQQLDSMFAINVKGVFFTVQKALPLLKDGSSIVLTSSIANSRGTPLFSVYSATKAAVRSLARSLTNDLRSRNIRVNSLSPGPTETPMAGKLGVPDDKAALFAASMAPQIPVGRMGRAEEVANAALFLASDESSFITGVDLAADGGMAQI